MLRRVMELNEFKEYFASFNRSSWHFAKPDDTSKLLRKIGCVSTKIHLHNDCVNLIDREIYSRFGKSRNNETLPRIPS